MPQHKLKCWTALLRDIWNGKRRFDIRKNDQNFEVGDTILLQEYFPDKDQYGNIEIECRISYILNDAYILSEFNGLKEGYVIFGFEIIRLMQKEV
jgi:hypothetical protein